jgi:molybdopterin converting factor small subunit
MGEYRVVTETQVITVRYWAGAKHAAGTDQDALASAVPLTLAEIRDRAVALHPDTRLADVLAVCSTLVGEQPVGSADPATVVVEPGSTVEFLPPFAGG